MRMIATIPAMALAAMITATAVAQEAVLTVESRQIQDRKAVFGTVQSVDITVARTRIGGTIESLTVDEGSSVAAEDAIASVRDPKLPIERAAVDARIEALGAQFELAKTELDRVQRLIRTGAATQARLDEAQTRLDVVRGDLAATRAQRAVIAERMAEGAVLAPRSGRVLQVHVTEGSVVLPGEPVATIAAEAYVLRLQLPERHARFLSVGDEVLVGARGMAMTEQEMRPGRVRQVYPEMDRGRVIADVEVDGLGDFFVGERTRVYVSTGSRETIVIPPDYIYWRFGLSYVRLKDGGEVVVQLGLPAAGGLEVLSGLRPGDVLVKP